MMLIVSLALCILSSPVSGADCGGDKNNGFELAECGSGKTAICCHPTQEVCLSGKPKDGDEQFACSSNRALYGKRLVKVFIIPICAELFLAFLFIHMFKIVRPLKPKPPIGMLCIVQTILAMLVVLSPVWKFGLYSAFLGALVFHVVNGKDVPRWVSGAIITLQFFNVLAITGAIGTTNGVFIPLGVLAADNVPSWAAGVIDSVSAGAACSAAYDNYFTLENVELAAEGADPKQGFHGLCIDNWIATVNTVVAVKMVVQLIMTTLFAKSFVTGISANLAEKADV